LKSPVELLQVYEPEPVYYYPGPAHYQERTQLANQHREEASGSLISASDMLKAAGISVTFNFLDAHSVPGQVSHEIPENPVHYVIETAHEVPNTLVVVCTHGRSGMGRWVMGSVTDRVVRYAAGPVLVTRSE